MHLLNPGDIFSVLYNGYNKSGLKYWKVTNISSNKIRGDSYRVISCSKTGKEFKERNGYSTGIDRFFGQPESIYHIVKQGGTVGEKANIDNGIKVGKMKRRLKYLQDRIARDRLEIHRLVEQLNRKEVQ